MTVQQQEDEKAVPAYYKVIARSLRDGEVIPFLGAGASSADRVSASPFNPAAPQFLPSGSELAQALASEAQCPASDSQELNDLAKISSFYVLTYGRPSLRKYVRRLIHALPPEPPAHGATVHSSCTGGSIHSLLASLPHKQLIVVTNYDTRLERAFDAIGKPYDLVVYAAENSAMVNSVLWWPHGATEPQATDPLKLQIDLANTNVIFKIHGTSLCSTSTWDQFVITEEDYTEFMTRMMDNVAIPPLFHRYFMERSFLFLGHSLQDWNVRVLLHSLRKYLGADQPPSWAFQRNPSQLDTALWAKRNLHIYNEDILECVRNLNRVLGH